MVCMGLYSSGFPLPSAGFRWFTTFARCPMVLRELLCPLTGIVFSPAGCLAILLTQEPVPDGRAGLVADYLTMRQAVLGYNGTSSSLGTDLIF